MLIRNEFDVFKKIILKRLRSVLKTMDIASDFIELSTNYLGIDYEIRIKGLSNVNGVSSWDIVRVVNRSIVPSDTYYNTSTWAQARV